MRTWKCPDCGKTTDISYDWLANHGGPICEKCDCDMELQPAAADDDNLLVELMEIGKELLEWANTMGGWEAPCWERLRTAISKTPVTRKHVEELAEAAVPKEQIERLTDKADAAGLAAEDLDDLVHELASSVASDVNNGGLEEQLMYLVDGIGAQQTERQLDELIENQQRQGE
jgi:hypothetical protein